MKKFRKFAGIVTAAVMMANLVGCGQQAEESKQETVTESTNAGKESDTETATGETKQAVDVVKIGIIEPFTGSQALQGETVRAAYEYVANQINENGGIKSLGGAKMELVFADHQSDSEVGMSETERLISQEGVSVVIGACNSGVVMSATQVTERMEVPFVVDVPAGIDITERGMEYVFRTNISATSYGETFVEFVNYLNKNYGTDLMTLGTLFDDTEAGRSLVETGIEGGAKENGMEVVSSQPFPNNSQDLTTFISKLKDANPDVLATHIGSSSLAVLAAQQAANLQISPKIIINANGGIELPAWQEEVGSLSENWFAMFQFNADLPGMPEIAEDYTAVTGKELDGFGALAMQTLHIVRAALESAGSTDPKAVRDALAGLEITADSEDMIMPWETIQFDEKGQNIGARNIVIQWQNGKRVTVYPESCAMAKPVIPDAYFVD